ncbi:MAG: GntG family PLP-dependent aldolase [Longimicrobiales bacterium]
MIDLRSDTVTRPTDAMREAMARAEVGDDVYGDDPTVNALQARVAELLGKEDAVFVTSGTLSNQIALRAHCEPGDMALMEVGAHIAVNEGGAAAALAGVSVGPIRGAHGLFGPEAVADIVEVPHPFNPPNHQPLPRLVCIENTHNGGGGVPWTRADIDPVADAARAHGLTLHMDGARLWHAAAATGESVGHLAEPFDTVSVCFSKGLGAPVGSALVGSRALIRRARRFKQQYGGGFRQGGILAAAALHALDHHRERLVDDIARARTFAEGLAGIDGVRVDVDRVRTNIVRYEVTKGTAGAFVDACHARGVHMLPGGRRGVRAVMHLGIDDQDVERALEVVRAVAAEG